MFVIVAASGDFEELVIASAGVEIGLTGPDVMVGAWVLGPPTEAMLRYVPYWH